MRALARTLAALTAVAAVLAGTASAEAAGTTVTVPDGGAPGWIRFDSNGDGVDAHDGEIKQFGAKYYLYGTAYSCGYIRMHGYGTDTRPVTPFCGFVVYESTDLRHWKYDGPVFDPSATTPTDWQHICNSATLSCYRPHVLYDAAAGMYRLWVNTYDKGADNVQHGYHVLSSASPTGPFVEKTGASGAAVLPKLAYPAGGDFDLYQDSNGAGYIVYAVTDGDPFGRSYNYKLVIEQLSSDYTTGTGTFTTLDTRKTEAPSMFRRGADYYVTMSDPQCAYCAGTGTTYLRAKTPLGPWRGVGGNVALTSKQLYVDSMYGLFTGFDSATQSRLLGLRDYDVTFHARPLPDTTTATTHTTRVGWMFRAKDRSNGYLWVLSSAPYAGKPARLSREVVKDGRVIATTNIGIGTRLSLTTMNTIRTRAIGTTIKTWLNGTLIDRFVVNAWSDRNFHTGYAGIREAGGYSAYFDDFRLSRPPVQGYRLYLADDFGGTSVTTFPTLGRFRRQGVRISDLSCGGQPDDVAMLPAPNTSHYEYLFQADRWDHGDQNEGQATQYWEPLKFNTDGSLRALTCATSHQVVLTSASGAGGATVDGYTEVQDITSSHPRGQSFQVTQAAGSLSLRLTLFQTDIGGQGPNQDLTVSLYEVDANGKPTGTPLTQTTVPRLQNDGSLQALDRSHIFWSPRSMTVVLSAPVVGSPDSPHPYAFVLSTTSTTGAYGTARADGSLGDLNPTGAGLVGASDGSWTLEPTNDLQSLLS